jgi:hypothetical protein
VKKLLIVAATVAGVLLYKKVQDSEARKLVWSESTDTVDSPDSPDRKPKSGPPN